MKKRLILSIGFVLLLASCQKKELSLLEVEIEKAPADVKGFVENSGEEEGANLYFNGEDGIYVFLTSGVVHDGDDTAHFTNAEVAANGQELQFSYERAYADDYDDDLKYAVLYKITTDQAYDTVKVVENGEEVGFNQVSGK